MQLIYYIVVSNIYITLSLSHIYIFHLNYMKSLQAEILQIKFSSLFKISFIVIIYSLEYKFYMKTENIFLV